ncbi:MAG: SDR family oxidoreductase [Oligoflexia bacterium]|nr:SDR family oxidoreductase [Oligoflexia bacterium]
MIKLSDKTIVVTGGTNDVGQAITQNLTAMGADIAIIDKNPEKANRLIDQIAEEREIKERNGRAAYFEADLTQPEPVKEAFSKAAETFGAIDVLVAGLFTSKVSLLSASDYLTDFERLTNVNLKSAVYATHAALPFMKGRKRGKIIFLVPDLMRWGSEAESLTAITRGGVIYYARSLARELAPLNISVNVVSIGPTEDYLLSRDPGASSIKVAEEKLMAAMPMGRTLRADEVAQVVGFLASPSADAVTGQTWAVNGGLTMM